MKLVFVSSTFKDMQYERDMLQTYAIPMLDSALREYGENVYFGDLRWGVNTTDLDSDEGSKKVLQVCLDQIDECKPYMVVLVGERYGWIPAQELIDEACILKGIDKIRDISVTELEIDYGALLNPEYEGRILFYFRDLDTAGMSEDELADYRAESPMHAQKVQELKKRIEKIYPEQIRYYHAKWDAEEKKVVGLEDFLSQVQADLSFVLLRDLQELNAIPWQERCMFSAEKWFGEKAKYTLSDTELSCRYKGSHAFSTVAFTFYIGKDDADANSQLLCNYGVHDVSQSHKLAFCFGLDKFSEDYMSLIQVIAYKMENILGRKHKEIDNYYGGIELIVDYIKRMKKKNQSLTVYCDNCGDDVVMFLSMLEQCAIDELGAEGALSIGETFKMEMAMSLDLPFYPFFPIAAVYDTELLPPEKSSRVLDSIIKSNHKEISDVVKERILSKEHNCYPSYLRGVIKRLLILNSDDFAKIRAMGDGMDNINRYMLDVVDKTSDDRFEVLLELVNEAKKRIDATFVNRLMSVFAHTAVYFSREEIKALFLYMGWEYSDLNFALTAKMLEDIVGIDPNGWYRIKSRDIEKMLKENAQPIDVKAVAEFMLLHDELRSSAPSPAVLCDDMEFIYSVVLRSGARSISRQIRYLVERGEEEKASDIIVFLSYKDGMKNIEMLPELHEYSLEFMKSQRDHPAGKFLSLLSYKAGVKTGIHGRSVSEGAPVLGECDKVLYEFSVQSEIMLIDEMMQDQPEFALHAIDRLMFHIKHIEGYYNYKNMNQLAFVTLKCIRLIGSKEIFEKCIGKNNYLSNFDFRTEYENRIFKMKAYYEYCKCLDLREHSDEEYDKLISEIVELANSFSFDGIEDELTDEDYIYLAEISGDYKFYYANCKFMFPQSIKLLMEEAADVQSCPYSSEEEYFEKFNVLFEYDLVHKAKSLMQFKGTKDNMSAFLNAASSYLFDVKLDEDDFDLVQEYFDCISFSCEYEEKKLAWAAQTRAELQSGDEITRMEITVLDRMRYGISISTYAGILDVCSALEREGYPSIIPIGLKMACRNEPLCKIIRDVAECLYYTGDREKLSAAYEEYLQIREDYLGIDAKAIEIMDGLFEDEGY